MYRYKFNSTFRIKDEAKNSLPRVSSKAARRASRLTVAKRRISPAETKWSRAVRERDNSTCQFVGCGKSYKSIDTHHIATRSLRPDLKFILANGISLCRQHHNWVHANRQEAVATSLLNLETYEAAKKKLKAA